MPIQNLNSIGATAQYSTLNKINPKHSAPIAFNGNLEKSPKADTFIKIDEPSDEVLMLDTPLDNLSVPDMPLAPLDEPTMPAIEMDLETGIQRGIYGQDINDPLDCRNSLDMSSPYYDFNNNQ